MIDQDFEIVPTHHYKLSFDSIPESIISIKKLKSIKMCHWSLKSEVFLFLFGIIRFIWLDEAVIRQVLKIRDFW